MSGVFTWNLLADIRDTWSAAFMVNTSQARSKTCRSVSVREHITDPQNRNVIGRRLIIEASLALT
jgi:hypothetical protein